MAAKKKASKKLAKKASPKKKAPARAKKVANKAPARAKKTPARAKKTPARAKKTPARLSAEQKLAKLKPGDDLNELIDDILTAWSRVGARVRVADISPAKLRSLGEKAQRASRREAELAAKQAAKLAPLTDARLVAGDAAYRAALTVKRIADAVAADDTEVAEAFAAVTERFRRGPAEPTPST